MTCRTLRDTDFTIRSLPLYGMQSISSIDSADVSGEVFSLAIEGSTADALDVPPSSVTIITIGTNRRLLLATVGITYTFDVVSGMTPAVIIEKYKKYSASGLFLNSLKVRSRLPIETLSTASITQVTPITPAVETNERSSKEGDRTFIATHLSKIMQCDV